ncbi:chemotaxis protein CheW [Sphingomonas changbaiensis NBRC 104936]|uniref:Chemotaxis protein CheW n=1 Tax=Sphingomonas changbaiensis NBRC 104936 TaxID=1219043 RepID=A0A0E9ML93_9SPHN|nr:chemotaxis protein CheW [Sphingomonas changbaiensis]GAO38309.1 chemotaxis protein CheW [Sphingomonas changbaiensis NBRC 104936]
MENLYLIATIAGQSVAIHASLVDSVVDLGAIAPVPLAPPHIAGLAALRSKVLTVVCCECALGFAPTQRGPRRAVVIQIDGHHYGLVVGSIEDARVIDEAPQPIRARLEPGWARIAIGMLEHDGEALLLIDPERLIAGADEALAA